MSRCGKEMVDESRKKYQVGSDIAVREFPCVRHDVKNMARETDLLVQTRGSLSNIVDVVAAGTHFEFCSKDRMTDQYDFVKEHYPSVELGSSVVNEQDDKAHQYWNEEREVVYLDHKCQLLEKDYQYDGVDRRMYHDYNGPTDVADRDDKALQSITLCLNKGREAYLDNERKTVYSDDKRRELRNEYHFGNDGRMHSDIHEANIVVD